MGYTLCCIFTNHGFLKCIRIIKKTFLIVIVFTWDSDDQNHKPYTRTVFKKLIFSLLLHKSNGNFLNHKQYTITIFQIQAFSLIFLKNNADFLKKNTDRAE